MGTTPQAKKFRINPVELVIFSTISLMLVNSLYHLFHDRAGADSSPWAVLTAPSKAEGENAAGAAPIFFSYDMKCDSTAQAATRAGKFRLNGVLCGETQTAGSATEGRSPASVDGTRIVKIEVANQANQFAATVFTDSNAGKFSTDYIPLNEGSNPIQVTFHTSDGKRTVRALQIDRK